MTQLTNQVVAVVVIIVITLGPGLAAALLLNWRKRLARQRRRSPLTAGLLRTPGHALREQLEEMRVGVALDLALLLFFPAFLLAFFYLQTMLSGSAISMRIHAIALVGVSGFSAYQTRKMWRCSVQMDKLRLGLDAELAVGQELEQLMREGAAVFHDLPAEKFNIDHVVIAPQGVFAVETKGHAKPNRRGGVADAKVVFDGKSLAFPDWSSTKPVEQAERQAKWLANLLTSATGESVRVAPVLALPGWYVDRKGRGDVLVYSGKELRGHLLKAPHAQPLNLEQLRRVIHQVEQRCRNVEPEYRPEEARG